MIYLDPKNVLMPIPTLFNRRKLHVISELGLEARFYISRHGNFDGFKLMHNSRIKP